MRSKMACVTALATLLLLSNVARADHLNLKVFRMLDHLPASNAFLFRGNHPLHGSGHNARMDYTGLTSAMRSHAAANNVDSFPASDEKLYVMDITFEEPLDDHFKTERDYWKHADNKAKGEYHEWTLIGAPNWATKYSPAKAEALIKSGIIWAEDKLPTRMVKLGNYLKQGPPANYTALAVYVHGHTGCGVTSEFTTAYRMTFKPKPTLREQYAIDCDVCESSQAVSGCPNYFATGAIGWYCLTWNMYNTSPAHPALPDCFSPYDCVKDLWCNLNTTRV